MGIGPWSNTIVCQLLARNHLQPGRTEKVELAADGMVAQRSAPQARNGGPSLAQLDGATVGPLAPLSLRAYYIIWADADELKRLRKLKAFSHDHPSLSAALHPEELITPNTRKLSESKLKAQGEVLFKTL